MFSSTSSPGDGWQNAGNGTFFRFVEAPEGEAINLQDLLNMHAQQAHDNRQKEILNTKTQAIIDDVLFFIEKQYPRRFDDWKNEPLLVDVMMSICAAILDKVLDRFDEDDTEGKAQVFAHILNNMQNAIYQWHGITAYPKTEKNPIYVTSMIRESEN